jgi:hypothetical protein
LENADTLPKVWAKFKKWVISVVEDKLPIFSAYNGHSFDFRVLIKDLERYGLKVILISKIFILIA